MIFQYLEKTAQIEFHGAAGAGRAVRKAKTDSLKSLRILADTSAVEIYLNDGETVFSTRYYPDKEKIRLKISGGKFKGNIWNLNRMLFTK